MNKTEKIICILLGAVLAWYLFIEMPKQSQAAADAAKAQAAAATTQVPAETPSKAEAVQAQQPSASEANAGASTEKAEVAPATPSVPERIVVLENDEVKLELSTWGGVVKKATLKKFARDVGEISEENPAVELDFAAGRAVKVLFSKLFKALIYVVVIGIDDGA